jgi:hypothetical protein
LFLAAAARLDAEIASAVVVGDSIWNLLARRARALGVGLLSGGYGKEELERAGAYRVYEDPRDLLEHLDEVGCETHARWIFRSRHSSTGSQTATGRSSAAPSARGSAAFEVTIGNCGALKLPSLRLDLSNNRMCGSIP